jgi:hypothetical protein
MKQSLPYLLLGTAALAACSEAARNETDLPSSPGVIVAAPPGSSQPTGCSFRDAKTYARNYFLVNTDRQAATSALSAAEDFAVGTQDRTGALFAVLGLVAKVGGGESGEDGGLDNAAAGDSGDPLVGARLVNEVVDCGPLVVTDKRDFLGVLTSALTDLPDAEGEFAIRGTSAGDDAVVAESEDIAIAPNVGKPDWIDQVGRVAVFAGQVSGIGFGGIGTDLVTPYRIGLIYEQTPPRVTAPVFTDDDYFAVEFCNVNQQPTADQQRVGRSRGVNNELNTVLQQSDIQGFCTDLTSSLAPSRSFFARAVVRLADFLLPTSLQALIAAPPPPWSGSTGGLESDFGVVEFDTVVVIPGTIPNGVKGQAVNFTVSAFTGPSAPYTQIPLENVAITVTVAGNQGDPVFLSSGDTETTTCTENGLSCTAYTDEFGAAHFSVIFDKAGGYTLHVTPSYEGFALIMLLSNLFNITGN